MIGMRRFGLIAVSIVLIGALGSLFAATSGAYSRVKGSSCAHPNRTRWSTGGMDPTTDTRDVRVARDKGFGLDFHTGIAHVVYRWRVKHSGVIICKATLEYWVADTSRPVSGLTVHLATGRTSGMVAVSYSRNSRQYHAGVPNIIVLSARR